MSDNAKGSAVMRASTLISLLPLVLGAGPAAEKTTTRGPISAEVAGFSNLVENGGFEEGDLSPAYWNRHPPKDADGNRLARDASVARSGRASGSISGAPLEPGQTTPNLQWNKYGIPVEGGSALILSCYVKTEGTSPFRVGCHFYDEHRRHLGFTGVPFPKSQAEWVYLREQVVVPRQARQMGFVLYAHAPGKTWYDDVAVLGTPSVAAVRGDPLIDGKLDDACWTAGQAISQFIVHTGTKLPTEATRAWIAYDDEALVVAFHCPHPNRAGPRARATDDDGETRLDDSIEVFLDPDHDHDDYFRLCVNCQGRVRDARGTDGEWESAAEAVVERGAEAWNVEVRIPYDHLGVDINTGTTWGINLLRNDRVHDETSIWSLGGRHDARRFGNVKLEPDLWRFRRLALADELVRREREIDQLRTAMRDAGMTAGAMAKPNQMLDNAEQEIQRLRQRINAVTGDDAAILTELRRALGKLASVVPEARSTATQFMFTTDGAGEGGFRVAIAHSLQKVPRTGAWDGGLFANGVRLEAARDETESFQLVLMPNGSSLERVSVDATALQGPGGKIPVEWHRVDYVETVPPKYPTAYVGWWPDPLLPPGPFDVAADRRQPLWLRVSVPPGAAPGSYAGRVTIRHGGRSIAVPVELRVRNFRLPRPGTLATAFGNYAWVLSEGYYGKGDYREKMAIDDYARWCAFLGRYRIGAKNSGREYTSVTRDGDAWRVDLSALESTVADLARNCYAPYSVAIHRLPSSPQFEKPRYRPNAEEWAQQVRAIADEWKRQGLPSQVFVYGVDEPRPDQYPLLREAYGRLHELVPGFPIMQTVNHREPRELAGAVDIWCPLTSRLESEFYAERRQAGDTLWAYVCCSPTHPYANFFIDRPATEHRVLFWQVRKAGATGFLYWCACWWQGLPTPGADGPSWPDVPLRMKDHGASAPRKINGDGLLIYPGPNMTPYPSIRLEVIRDGIEDFEYLGLLSRLLERVQQLPVADQPKPDVLARAEELCDVPESISRSTTEYTDEPDDLFGRRREVGDMIEQLTGITALR
jgi:hypothetical protein